MDWRRLQLHGIAPEHAFEAMCTQLFDRWLRHQYGDRVVECHSLDGCGGDGGVEAYAVLNTGEHIGLQCKWFSKFGPSERRKADASVAAAVGRHQQLSRYIIAMPLRLKDAKSRPGARSELDAWGELIGRWRPLSVERWDDSDFDKLLPSQPDIMEHWFGEWQGRDPASRVRLAVHSFRHRYAPEDPHIAGTLGRQIEKILRLPDARSEALAELGALVREGRRLERAVASLAEFSRFRKGRARDDVNAVLSTIGDGVLVVESLRQAWLRGRTPRRDDVRPSPALNSLLAILAEGGDEEGPFEPHRRAIAGLSDWLHQTRSAQFDWESGAHALAVVGPPGCGKTNGVVIASLAHAEIRDSPVFLLSAREVDPRTGLQPILARALDRPALSLQGAVAALEAEAHSADARRRTRGHLDVHGTKTLLIIDGLEESRPLNSAWSTRLAELVELLKSTNRVVLVVTVRQSAVRRCLPEELVDVRRWSVASTGDVGVLKLLNAYCRTYGITLDAPSIVAGTLRTPLAVRLFARLNRGATITAAKMALVSLPKLIQRWVDELEEELRRDDDAWPDSEAIVLRVITGSMSLVLEKGGSIEREALIQALTDQCPPGALPRARALRLIERSCDYAIFDQSIMQGTDPLTPPQVILGPGDESIADYLLGRAAAEQGKHLRSTGVPAPLPAAFHERPDAAVFAAAALLNAGLPLTDTAIWPTASKDFRVNTMLSAVSWAEEDVLPIVAGWVHGVFTGSKVGSRAVVNLLVLPLCRAVGHRYGASWLHDTLSAMPLQARDALWSAPDRLPINHGAVWEGWADLETDALQLWDQECWSGAPLLLTWTLTSLVEERVRKGRDRLACWGATDPAAFCDLFEAFVDVQDPQLHEELLVVAADIALRAEAEEGALLRLATLVGESVFGHGGGLVVANIRMRVAGRIVIEQAAAKVPGMASSLIAVARPPYAVPPQLLPLSVDGALAASVDGAPHRVEMLDWDLWSYVVQRRAGKFAGASKPRRQYARPPSVLQVGADVRAGVKSRKIRLNGRVRVRLTKLWSRQEASALRRRGREVASRRKVDATIDLLLRGARSKLADLRSIDPVEVPERDVYEALRATLPRSSLADASPSPRVSAPIDELRERYSEEYGVPELTNDGLFAGIVIAHVREHGWTEDVHRMDPRGEAPGETLGLDIAILRAYGHARQGSRSSVAMIAEKYAFSGVHVLLGHLAQFLPWWNEAEGTLGPCNNELEVSSTLLQGFPSRAGAPRVRESWPEWRPPVEAPHGSSRAAKDLERAVENLVAPLMPNPETLLAGPVPGTVVLAADHVTSGLGVEPDSRLWISAFAGSVRDVRLFARDVLAGVDAGHHLHESFRSLVGTYVPTDLAAVSQWLPLTEGEVGHATVDEVGEPVQVVLTALSTRNLDHDGESELHCYFPADLLRRVWPIVQTRGDDDQRHFVDAEHRVRAVAERASSEPTWENSAEALFVRLDELEELVKSAGLGVVWGLRLYWEVPTRLWSAGAGTKRQNYPSVRSREARWILTRTEGGWRTLWAEESLERSHSE